MVKGHLEILNSRSKSISISLDLQRDEIEKASVGRPL